MPRVRLRAREYVVVDADDYAACHILAERFEEISVNTVRRMAATDTLAMIADSDVYARHRDDMRYAR